MSAFWEAAHGALGLILAGDPTLGGIVLLSLEVSLSAVVCATLLGLPLGAAIAVGRFPGRRAVVVMLNALMGLPPVVVGLFVYLILSRAGPLGALGILFTPGAMVLAQTILVLPIIAALCRQAVEDAWIEYEEQLRSLGAHGPGAALTLVWDIRFSLLTAILAGLGRASAEVGAVMIVGGNIDGVTRVMTTTIALETSKGDLPLALSLGIVLIALVLALNAAAFYVKDAAQRRYGVVSADGRILPLELRDACFRAGGRTIIDRVSVEISAGPSSIILGANGAGKSVLMRLMHGLLTPTSGEVGWRETDPEKRRRQQAMVFQRPVLLRRSALANVTYALKVACVPRRERERLAVEALESVGLLHLAHRPARVLSGGEQQRLALARAWALHPEVLFLDEPTASLDPSATREIERVIGAFDAAGTKIIMATHNLGQVRRLGDEVLFVHLGRLVERAAVDEFFSSPASPEAAAFIKGELPWT